MKTLPNTPVTTSIVTDDNPIDGNVEDDSDNFSPARVAALSSSSSDHSTNSSFNTKDNKPFISFYKFLDNAKVANENDAALEVPQSNQFSPLDSANFFSRLTLFWISPLIYLGFKRPLEQEDLWQVAKRDAPAPAASVFASSRIRNNDPSLPKLRTWSALYKSYSYDAWFAAALYCVAIALKFVGPFILGVLVTFVQNTQSGVPTITVEQAYGCAGLLFGSQFLGTFFSVKSDFLCMRLGLKARNALIGSTFRQVMSLDNVGRLQTNNGNIISLVTSDSLVALEFTRFFNQAWTAPLVLVGGIVYIYALVGIAVWAGLSILILFVPYSIWQGKLQAEVQGTKMLKTDARVKVTNEALQGIKVVKVNAWEDSLISILDKARYVELKDLLKLNYLQASLTPLSISAPNIACVITFLVYVSLGNSIVPATAFQVVSLFVIIRQPFVVFPMAISQTTRAIVMGRRFDKLFNVPSTTFLHLNDKLSSNLQIEKESSFSWKSVCDHNPDSDFTLKVPNGLFVEPGELVAIVGKVASGKSSLCSALLGEMTRLQGFQSRPQSIAICLQDAFILNDTVRANILFGQEYNQARYDESISCSSLKRDLETLPGGDAAEIGERGINLSGGQKARVALARAAYSLAKVVILDDVLAAVDAEVGAYIFEHMLLGALKNRTRIVVTNNLDLLHKVDRIIVMDSGLVAEIGSREELLGRRESKLNTLLQQMAKQQQQDGGAVEDRPHILLLAQHSIPRIDERSSLIRPSMLSDPSSSNLRIDPATSGISVLNASSSTTSSNMKVYSKTKDEFISTKNLMTTKQSFMTVDENRQRGVVSNEIYRAYFLAGSSHRSIFVFLLFFMFIATEGNYLAIDSYLALSSQQTDLDVPTFMTGYSLIAVSFLILMLIRSFAFARFHVTAVKEIYEELSHELLKMPMAFYWREPLGRILNRVSADTNITDTLLGQSWSWLIMTVARVVGILVIIIVCAPIFAVTIVPLVCLYLIVREFYRRAARELQRIEGVTRSPLYNHLTETLNGTTTIRAYGRMEEWLEIADAKLITNHRAKFAVEACSVWLVMYSEWLGALVIFLTGLVIVGYRESVGPGFAGLALSFSLNIVVNLNMSVRQATLVEQQMTAIERVLQTASQPGEEGLDVGEIYMDDQKHDEKSWPAQGHVVFEHVVLRYREGLEPALADLSLELKAGERSGICGRTGAGKSSVLVALFRLVDPFKGRIVIDGVDICKIAKRVLRKRITMVPQDPVLFAATMRYNLDPFNEHEDKEIWMAMKQAHCDHLCLGKEDGLYIKVAEGGSNLSSGERALVCLARGILRKSSLVMLDEASAALDSYTDSLIQTTIREKFGKATLITIAHRLDTIVDLDSVCVMGDGKLLEKAHPALLLRDTQSHFYRLVEETGEESKERLARLAELAYENGVKDGRL